LGLELIWAWAKVKGRFRTRTQPRRPPPQGGRSVSLACCGTGSARCPTRRVSAATASVALRMVAAEGLIRLEQGKRSAVLPVRVYGAEVVVPHRGAVREEELAKADRRVRVQADDDPAIGEELSVANAGKRLRIWLAVTAADSGRAAARAIAVAAYACRAGDGWDLAGASVTARPA
jgi:hypothetical protein